jgi:hypothetical protein
MVYNARYEIHYSYSALSNARYELHYYSHRRKSSYCTEGGSVNSKQSKQVLPGKTQKIRRGEGALAYLEKAKTGTVQ